MAVEQLLRILEPSTESRVHIPFLPGPPSLLWPSSLPRPLPLRNFWSTNFVKCSQGYQLFFFWYPSLYWQVVIFFSHERKVLAYCSLIKGYALKRRRKGLALFSTSCSQPLCLFLLLHLLVGQLYYPVLVLDLILFKISALPASIFETMLEGDMSLSKIFWKGESLQSHSSFISYFSSLLSLPPNS